jgi:carbonic anhydrase
VKRLPHLFQGNRDWARRIDEENPGFFERLSAQQSPKYLWIGCADSRVPANEICGLDPGEMFVHRNIANVVVHTDFNCLSVVQYAVEVLKVEHIIVCGHYRCGGVMGALDNRPLGLIDNWLRNIKDVYAMHHSRFADPSMTRDERADLLCELNVEAQVANLCYTTIVQDAWTRGQPLAVHGWIYSLSDGLLRDLELCAESLDHLPRIYHMDT